LPAPGPVVMAAIGLAAIGGLALAAQRRDLSP
jgi:hypothetical protein